MALYLHTDVRTCSERYVALKNSSWSCPTLQLIFAWDHPARAGLPPLGDALQSGAYRLTERTLMLLDILRGTLTESHQPTNPSVEVRSPCFGPVVPPAWRSLSVVAT